MITLSVIYIYKIPQHSTFCLWWGIVTQILYINHFDCTDWVLFNIVAWNCGAQNNSSNLGKSHRCLTSWVQLGQINDLARTVSKWNHIENIKELEIKHQIRALSSIHSVTTFFAHFILIFTSVLGKRAYWDLIAEPYICQAGSMPLS